MALNYKFFATIFGIAFIVVGILGFVPTVTTDGMLLGLFMVDPMHNVIHLASGVAALVAACNASYAKLYFQAFGIIYGLVAILGFALDGNLYIIQVNSADNILHLVISIIALYLGFIFKSGK